jgi:hypothetical protein
MSIANLSIQQLRQAADLKEQIAGLEKQLASIIYVGGKTYTPVKVLVQAKSVKPAKKGGMSAAGKAKIAAAQKLRWAKVNAAKAKPAAVVMSAAKPAKKKFVMSAAAKAKISAAAKARWAKVKAAKK